jgi:hypothetical protein
MIQSSCTLARRLGNSTGLNEGETLSHSLGLSSFYAWHCHDCGKVETTWMYTYMAGRRYISALEAEIQK